MDEVTRILNAIEGGDPHAAEQLLPLVYDELRRLAAHRLAHEAPGHTLQPTALVHEAYLRLVGNGKSEPWDNRGHFFAAAAEAMRRILIEIARRKQRRKKTDHPGDAALQQVESPNAPPTEDLLALDEALAQFAQRHPAKAELVKLRFYAGLSVEDAARCLGISRATADRHWAYARAWLYGRLCPAKGPAD